MMVDLTRRSDAPELMDDLSADFATFDRCLRELERLNRLTLAYRPTLSWLDRLAARSGDRPLSILDVGCGRGDMLRRIAAWARRRGTRVELIGVDLNPVAVEAARRATPADAPIRYEVGDALRYAAAKPPDAIVSAIFAHHLTDSQLARFFASMDRTARLGWFVNDLHRHRAPYLFTRYVVGAFPFSQMVKHDGPVSVTRAFRRRDWEDILAQAGIPLARVEIRRRFPFRWGVGCLKTPDAATSS